MPFRRNKTPAPQSKTPPPATAQGASQGAVLDQLQKGQANLDQTVQNMVGASTFLRQQVSQLAEQVQQLYGAVSVQCVQLRDGDKAIQEEFRRFQSGGPQRVMAGVYQKLFRDLLGHMNQLEDLCSMMGQGEHQECEKPWMDAIRTGKAAMEAVLVDWGCLPLGVQIGEEFNPEIHESVALAETAQGADHSNRIVRVVRRGWQFGGMLIQHPQVVVG